MGRTKIKQIIQKTRKSSKVSNFKRNCKCTFPSVHFYKDDTSGRLYDVNTKEIKVRYKNWLHKTTSLSKNSPFICQGCLNIAIEKESEGEVLIQENSVESVQTESENTTNSTTENDSSLVSEVIDLIRNNEISLKDDDDLVIQMRKNCTKKLKLI